MARISSFHGPTFDELNAMASETGRIIAGLRNSLGATT